MDDDSRTRCLTESADEVVDAIICMVCLESFSPTRHSYSSRCGHLICLVCLDQLTKGRLQPSSLIRCPYCRRECRVDDYHRVNLCSSKSVTIDERKMVENNVRLIKRDNAKALDAVSEMISKERLGLRWIPTMVGKNSVNKASEAIVENTAIYRRLEVLENVKVRLQLNDDGTDRILGRLSK